MIDCAERATSRLNYELNNNDLRIQLNEIMVPNLFTTIWGLYFNAQNLH